MPGDIVKAARWLGGCIVVASLILVIGLHPTVAGRTLTFTKAQPEAAPIPSVPNPRGSAEYVPTGFVPAEYGVPQRVPCQPVAVTSGSQPAPHTISN